MGLIARGVVVPAGRHTVTMSYLPPGLVAGVAIALLTAALGLIWGSRRRP